MIVVSLEKSDEPNFDNDLLSIAVPVFRLLAMCPVSIWFLKKTIRCRSLTLLFSEHDAMAFNL